MANDGDASSDNRVLLVEGRDEMHVVCHLCESNSMTPTFTVSPKGGIDPLLNGIRSEISVEGRAVVGIVVDANDNLQSRWQSVADRLRAASIEMPPGPASNGTIIESRPREGKPRVGIWLMPDNESPGELEDFIADMIPSGDPVWPMSEDYIEGIPVEHRKFKKGKILRAKVHAWLATREEPRPMGIAIRAGDLNTATEKLREIRWLATRAVQGWRLGGSDDGPLGVRCRRATGLRVRDPIRLASLKRLERYRPFRRRFCPALPGRENHRT